MPHFRVFPLIFAGLPVLLFCGDAAADTDQTSFDVTVTVIDSCNVTAQDLDFGDYDPVSATSLDAATTLSVTCTFGADYDVGLSVGLGAGATHAARKMTNSGTDTLTYGLYRDGARSQVWGETIGVNTIAGTGSGAAQVIDVYGRAPIAQTAPADSYEDTITVTVTY